MISAELFGKQRSWFQQSMIHFLLSEFTYSETTGLLPYSVSSIEDGEANHNDQR